MAVETGIGHRQPVDTLPLSDGSAWGGLGAGEIRERLFNIGECLMYFDQLSGMPASERDASIVGVSESMVDAFFTVDAVVPGREGADQELLVSGQGTYNLGGGANVIRGASLFARRVKMITRTGQLPPLTAEVNSLLEDLPTNVQVARIIDPNSQNAIKIRFLDDEGIVTGAVNFKPAELDDEGAVRLAGETADAIDEFLEDEGECTLVVSDYGRGQLTGPASSALSTVFRNSLVGSVFLDPRPNPEALDKFNVYGAILTPNRGEAQLLAGGEIREGKLDSAHGAAESILGNYPDVRGVIVTLDSDGAISVDRDGTVAHSPAVIKDSDVINPSGAGDIVIAVNALLSRSGFDTQTALDAAVWLAGISAKEKNTSTLSPELVGATQTAVNHLLRKL